MVVDVWRVSLVIINFTQRWSVKLKNRLVTWRGYSGTSLIRNTSLLGPYIRTMPRAVWWF